jgi:hypothetical protein
MFRRLPLDGKSGVGDIGNTQGTLWCRWYTWREREKGIIEINVYVYFKLSRYALYSWPY